MPKFDIDETPLPADEYELAAFLKATDDSPAVNDLYVRMETALGSDKTNKLWDLACRENDHDAATEAALADLTNALGNAQTALFNAASALHRLRAGEAWHVEYADSQAGCYIATFLDDAARMMRAAAALHREAGGV